MKTENFTEPNDILSLAIDKLGADFPNLNWDFRPDPSSGKNELVSQWLGEKNENVMACVFKGKHINEKFHRQDFFFLNFAYKGNYNALSAQQIAEYIALHSDKITLAELSRHFGYHPAYISALLPRETGKKFSEILNETRMRKAKMLLENTNLTIEKISEMTGFSATSNFYKAFKEYFGKTPKQLITITN